MRFLKSTLIFTCLLTNLVGNAQFRPFLADTVISKEIINSLHPQEKHMLDSMVKVINYATTDLDKLKAINYLIDNSMSINVWPKYNDLVLQLTNMNINDLEQFNEELIHERAEALGNKGFYFIQTGSYSKALHQYELAYQLASYIHDTVAITAVMTNIAGINQRIGYIEKAIEQYAACIKLYQLTNNEAAAAPAISNLGVIFHSQGEIDKAIEFFNRAYSIAEKQNNLSSMAARIVNIASIMIDKNLLDSARAMYLHALTLNDEAGNETGMATDLNGLGMVHARKGEYHAAIKYIKKSLRIKRREMDAEGECASLIIITNNLIRLEDYKKAFAYSDTAFLIANKIHYKRLIMEAALSRYAIFTVLNRNKEALEMFQFSIEMKDSIRNIETESATIRQLMRFEVDERNLIIAKDKIEIEKQQTELKLNQFYNTSLLVGIGLVSLFLIIAFLLYRNKRKYSIQLEIQKREITMQATELERLDSVKNRLFSIIAHDFKAPLITVGSLVNLWRSGSVKDDELEEFKDQLSNKIEHTTDFLSNLLCWAQTQMKGVKVKRVPLVPQHLINEVINVSKHQAELKQINLNFVSSVECEIKVDKEMFKIVFRNLLSNAIKFSPKNSEIIIKENVIDNTYKFSIIDAGAGISDEIIPTLFTLGAKSTDGTDNEKGTGLGLILCKEYVELNEGTIATESESGKGATFVVSFSLSN